MILFCFILFCHVFLAFKFKCPLGGSKPVCIYSVDGNTNVKCHRHVSIVILTKDNIDWVRSTMFAGSLCCLLATPIFPATCNKNGRTVTWIIKNNYNDNNNIPSNVDL